MHYSDEPKFASHRRQFDHSEWDKCPGQFPGQDENPGRSYISLVSSHNIYYTYYVYLHWGAMNKNITMSMNIELLKRAKKIAIEKNTTVSNLIRNFLQQLVEKENQHRNQVAAELESLFNNTHAQVGIKDWSREELHER